MKYDPREVINLLRSPFVDRPLSQLHSGEKDGIVPSSKARSLQAALVGWLKGTGSSYATAVAQRRMNTTHINQVPVLATPVPSDVTWQANRANTLTLPASTFLDVDGDSLTFAGTLDRGALPPWLRVHPKDGSVHGTPPSAGSHLLRVTATDRKSGAAFVELQLHAR